MPGSAARDGLTVIAVTGERFTDFAPYVASIDDAGIVAFQAALEGGRTSVFTGDGQSVSEVAGDAWAGVISHPDIDGAGSTCFYAELPDGERGVVVAGRHASRVVARSGDALADIGPLGPTMSRRGAVAYRATTRDGREGVFAAGPDGALEIATAGDRFASFDGLPDINDGGDVVFRAETAGGGAAIGCRRTGADELEIVAHTGEHVTELGRFPVIDDTGAVGFIGVDRAGRGGVFVSRSGQLDPVVRSGEAFASFRGVLIDGGEVVVFYATPPRGEMAIYAGTDPLGDRVLGVGDPLLGSAITAFVLNPVSVNARRQIAVRCELNDGRGVIVRVDVS